MVAWKESRLVDRHRFPKPIVGIGLGPEEEPKLPRGSRQLGQLLGLTEQARFPSASRGGA